MKRTTVLDVLVPLSPSPAPFLLRGWLAHVERTSIRRSNPESMEKIPTNNPTGGKESRCGGGKGEMVVPEEESLRGKGDDGDGRES